MNLDLLEVFLVFFRLGFTSFGGPVAHLSYFHEEFVNRKKWISEHAYADLVALCQFLPGPASSQVGIAVGLSRSGYLGAIAAWIGFTLPSAIFLILFGLGISSYHISDFWLHGLKVAAVAVVAQALWGMAVKLCPDKPRASIAIIGSVISAIFPYSFIQFFVIIFGSIIGLIYLRKKQELPHTTFKINVSRSTGAILLITFFSLLILLPILANKTGLQFFKIFDSFFRAGSLVFGGGHVILPLLQSEVVQSGWITKESFMAGYGAAQVIPGPLFTFTAYLGSVSKISPSGWLGGFICLIASFLPSFFLVIGVMPFWEKMRLHSQFKYATQGINAAVVGLLLSAFYNPVWMSSIFSHKDFALASLCFLLLVFWKLPSWSVVIFSTIVSFALL